MTNEKREKLFCNAFVKMHDQNFNFFPVLRITNSCVILSPMELQCSANRTPFEVRPHKPR